MESKITFDRFARWAIAALGCAGGVWLVNRLSGVLLPFFVAWLLAYLLYPLVRFFQYRLRLRSRFASIVAAMGLALAALAGLAALVVPPMIEESVRLGNLLTLYFHDTLAATGLAARLEALLADYADGSSFLRLAQQSSFVEAMEGALAQAWRLVSGTIDLAVGVLGFFVVLLYMFFLLMDYEKICRGWILLVPPAQRPVAAMVAADVESGMSAYFRGQALVALCVGVLFSAGFLLIGFPMAIGLGLFIGALNLIPYLQLIGLIPTVMLAMLKAADTGCGFWTALLGALAVFAVVQAIQDMLLTPRIMGRVMGLNPAVILLSLSVWGSLLGLIGFIVALPLTTLLLSYYRRFVLKETAPDDTPRGEMPR